MSSSSVQFSAYQMFDDFPDSPLVALLVLGLVIALIGVTIVTNVVVGVLGG